MKKFLFSMICTLFPILASAQEVEPYAILIDDGTALEFRYDDMKSAYRDAMDIGPFTEAIQRGWESSAEGIKSVVFNESFANCTTITSTAYWFAGLSNLETFIGLEYLNTSNVTNMYMMFYNCTSLASLDLSYFNTQNVTDMSVMFGSCNALTTIIVGSDWTTDHVEESGAMFESCFNLVGGNGTTFSQMNTDASYAHIDTEDHPGYLTGSSSGDEPYWQELNYAIEHGSEVLVQARESGNVDQWLLEELEMTLENANEMYNKHEADEEEVRNMTEELNDRIYKVEEAMKGGGEASEETWERLQSMIDYGSDILSQARESSKVDQWLIEELEMTLDNAHEMYKEHTATEEEVLNMIDELEWRIREVEEAMKGGGEEEPYAVLSEDNTVLTFYYDDQKEARGGMDVGPFTESSQRGWYEEWDNHKIESVVFDESFADCTTITSTKYWFSDLSKLTTIKGLDNLKTNNVTDMSYMFDGCEGLTSLDLSGFNTANVTNMSSMFAVCSLTDLDLSGFNTSNVTNLSTIFANCSSLTSIDVSGFDTSKAIDMSGMFRGCSSLTSLDLSSFNTSNVTLINGMFEGCESLESIDVSAFDTSKVTDMSGMFRGCSSLMNLDLSGFNTSNVTNIRKIFENCSSLTSIDVSAFDTSKVTDMSKMFENCSSLTNLDLSGFNTANVSDMYRMFAEDSLLTTIYVGDGWSTDNISSEDDGGYNLFKGCIAIVGGEGTTYDESPYDVDHDEDLADYTYAHIDGGESNPGYFTRSGDEPTYKKEPYAVLSEDNTVLTFYYDNEKEARGGMDVGPFTKYDQRGWDEQSSYIESVVFDDSFADCTTITSTSYWFMDFHNLTTISGLENLKTDNVTGMRRMFTGCGLTSLDLSGFNTSNVTDMNGMFEECDNLTSLDVSGFNTSKVTDMSTMFCQVNLTEIDISGFDTSEVIDMSEMFADSRFTSLDVSNFNTFNVTNMEGMFAECEALTSLDISSFNTSNVTDMHNMFERCSSLTTIYVGEGWSTENISSEDGGADMFRRCTAIVGGEGTTFDENHVDYTYAHIDGGESNPGYFTRSGSGEEEPYAVLSEDNTILTFYYDNEKEARGGMDVGPFEDGGRTSGSGWSEFNEQITTVVFDESFANCTTLTSTAYWFYGCENLTTITDFNNLKTDNVTDINSMFSDCHSLTSIDFSSLNLSNVTNMSQVFEDCRTLESIDFRGVNTENVTDMSDLFLNCHNLRTIDLSSFNTRNVTNMSHMFCRCDSLTTIYVGEGWNTENVTESDQMFERSANLVGGLGTTYDENHIGIEYAHIDGGVDNPGYLTGINEREAYFDGLTAWVYGDATLNDAFAAVGREAAVQTVAAIVWEANGELTSEQLEGITNPNLLIYVNEASKAPADVQNVIIDGVAEEIILTDATGNNNFYCPQPFTAKSISYSRDFSQTTELEVSRGWETIALPFDVQSISHESHGNLIPFGGEDNGYHFWLRQLSEQGLERATQIEANKPYLISMPNNTIYPSVYNQNGIVTFSSTDVTVPETNPQSDAYADVTLHAAFQQVEQGSDVYALNVGEARGDYPEGSVFEQNYRDIRPFQAYTTHRAGTRFIPLGSLGGKDGATGINELRVENGEKKENAWYSLDGRRLYVKPTKKGVYVKDGQKIVIK